MQERPRFGLSVEAASEVVDLTIVRLAMLEGRILDSQPKHVTAEEQRRRILLEVSDERWEEILNGQASLGLPDAPKATLGN